MILSGLQKLSLIDYPGKVACVVFTLGCNLRCHFCHNPEFVLPEKIRAIKDQILQEKIFFDFLESRQGLLDGVSVCGWEPTIHGDLPRFLREIKKRGFLVKLDTNGRNPEMLEKLLDEELVDFIAMDIKHIWENYWDLVWISEEITPYMRSVNIIKDRAPEYEFRTTLIQGVHTREDIEIIASHISDAKSYVLQNFHRGDILDPLFQGHSFSDEVLHEMQSIGAKYVRECSMR